MGENSMFNGYHRKSFVSKTNTLNDFLRRVNSDMLKPIGVSMFLSKDEYEKFKGDWVKMLATEIAENMINDGLLSINEFQLRDGTFRFDANTYAVDMNKLMKSIVDEQNR